MIITEAMNTLQLSAIMAKFSKNSHFLGVLACDQLPRNPLQRLPVSVIINTHTSDLAGEHWLAVYITDASSGCFFDSFGNKPNSPLFPTGIYTFLKTNCSTIQFSNRQVQDYAAITCGEHCVFFIYNMLNGLNYIDVMSKYSHDLLRNDNMVSTFVKKLQPCKCSSNMLCCIQHVQDGAKFSNQIKQ